MADLAKCASIAERLEESRAVVERLAGANYQVRVKPWCDLVSSLADKWGCKPLEVPLRLERDGAMPEMPLWLFAAVLELTEAGRA